MCRLRLFYFENGQWGWAEWVLPYGEDLQAHIDHWKIGGRMVTTEHIDLVQQANSTQQAISARQILPLWKNFPVRIIKDRVELAVWQVWHGGCNHI